MAQPPEYNRTKDFTVNFANETDHTALNSEFDAASNSINDIRNNLAILQADDGKLRPSVITMESISSAVYDGIIAKMAGQDISKQVLTQAESFSLEAKEQAEAAATSAAKCESALETLADWKNAILETIYPVTCTFISFSKNTPPIGTWVLIEEGTVLLAAGDTYQAGTSYGANTIKLTTDQLPAHNHTATIGSAGSHTHTRGTMNITGEWRGSTYDYQTSGAIYTGNNSGTGGGTPNKSGATGRYLLDAARNWTGATSSNGSHSHTATINKTGDNAEINIMQKSIALYIFRRIA